MKLIVTALFASSFALASVNAEEKAPSQKATKAPKQAKMIEVKAPFENHWDSKSWEDKGGENFWHAIPQEKKAAAGK